MSALPNAGPAQAQWDAETLIRAQVAELKSRQSRVEIPPERFHPGTSKSLADNLASLPEAELEEFLASLSPEQSIALIYDWEIWGRENQLLPSSAWWFVWFAMAGRGFGKTRIGAEAIRSWAEEGPNQQFALVGATAADVRDVMLEGPSGLLTISPPWFMPLYEPSKRRLTWPNGARGILFSADKPDRLRGPQFHGAWGDEIAAWRFPAALDNLLMSLRLGDHPRLVVTTTPRPTKIIKELVRSSTTIITHGTTYENLANLAPTFREMILRKYEGTRLGKQELLAEILSDVPGALWRYEMFEDRPEPLHQARCVVAIDPSVSSGEDADDTGIVVGCLDHVRQGFILADRTVHDTPINWAREAINAYYDYRADCIVAEVNNGGDLVAAVIHSIDPNVPVVKVHASRGKMTRAQPVASLYEQGRVKHAGVFMQLEEELCTWEPSNPNSPNRLDACVWCITELMLGAEEYEGTITYNNRVSISPY
jgi:phage terminase large subunit-like protein